MVQANPEMLDGEFDPRACLSKVAFVSEVFV
jgi:hypothetical protein